MRKIVPELQRYLFDEIVVDPRSPGGCLGLVYKGKCAIWYYKIWNRGEERWYPSRTDSEDLQRIQAAIGPSQDPQPDFSKQEWKPELDRTLHKWTPDGEMYLFTKKVSSICSDTAPNPLRCSQGDITNTCEKCGRRWKYRWYWHTCPDCARRAT